MAGSSGLSIRRVSCGPRGRSSSARGTDPWESHLNAPLNTIVPETSTPSHQGPDLQTILPDLDVVTMAAKGPFDLGHVHFTMVETTRPTSVDEVRSILEDAPRVAFVRAADGLGS